MAFIVKCTNGITISKKDGITHVVSGDFTLKLYDWHKVREFLVQIYLLNEDERNSEQTEEPHCFIEIITDKGADIVLEYPYSLRNKMLLDYDVLKEAFKPHMKGCQD